MLGNLPSDINPVGILRKIALFALLDKSELDSLAAQLDYKKYLAGQMIFSAGDTGSTMYVVISGEVELFLEDDDEQRVSLQFVQPGMIFGELALLDDEPRSASALAVRPTEVFIVDRSDLMMLVRSHPAAALDMMAMLGRRIREANALVRNRVARNVNVAVKAHRITFGERLSDLLVRVAGNIWFVYFSLIWFVGWIVWNNSSGLPTFDPPPYGLLTMVVSLEAIFLSLFVLISQNRQTEREKIRNDIEYEVNLKAEVEIRGLMRQVDHLQQLVLKYLAVTSTEDVDKLSQQTSRLRDQLDLQTGDGLK
jgi:CRP-like cAMP-binding protein